MDTLETYKLLLSYPDCIRHVDIDNIFQIQKYILSNIEDPQVSFDPLEWLARYIDSLSSHKLVNILQTHYTEPVCMLFDNLCIFKNGKIVNINKVNICILALKYQTQLKEKYFDSRYYYYLYHEEIDHYFTYKNIDISNEHKSCMFYCCYGYFLNINLVPICPLEYIASYPQLIQSVGLDARKGLEIFMKNGNKILFDPVVYVASNWDNKQIQEFVDCIGRVDEERATKHYIRYGFVNKLEHDSFNEWNYLANNKSRIKKVLKRCTKNKKKIEFDVFTLTKRNIAMDFIKKRGFQKTNEFDSTAFLKRYVDDVEPNEGVNRSKKLTLSNAAEFFVKHYVLSKKVRYESSIWYKISVFLQNRAIDSAKQIPYNAARYIVQTKIF